MGWSIGYDDNWKRDIGYGVPAICDHPACSDKIDRGLAFVCGSEPYGGEHGCGLYFCSGHLYLADDRPGYFCIQCLNGEDERFKPKPDTQEWIQWKLTDESWAEWRKENPAEVKTMTAMLLPLTNPTER